MISNALSILSVVALGAAQSSTVSLFLPFFDRQSLVASIAGSDSTATSYVVTCASPSASSTAAAASASSISLEKFPYTVDSNDCGLTSAITIIQGPSTMRFALTIADVGTESLNCQLMGTTQAICIAAASGSALTAGSDSVPALATETLSASEYSFIPVVITAGFTNVQQTSSSSMLPTGSATASRTSSGVPNPTSGTQTRSTTSGATTGTSSTAKTQSTNVAMQRAPFLGAGVVGAFGVAVAGAML